MTQPRHPSLMTNEELQREVLALRLICNTWCEELEAKEVAISEAAKARFKIVGETCKMIYGRA